MNAANLTNDFAHYSHKLCQLCDASGYSVLFAAAIGFVLLAVYHCKRTY